MIQAFSDSSFNVDKNLLENASVDGKCFETKTPISNVNVDVAIVWVMHLFFGLSLLYQLSAYFNARSENGFGEVNHINPLQMAHFLCSWWIHLTQHVSILF